MTLATSPVGPASAGAIATGAEARIEATTFLGRAALRKHRLVKTYRHPTLDGRLRDARTRDEANLLVAARRAGVSVPVVLDIDRAEHAIVMEPIVGGTLQEALVGDGDAAALARMAALGTEIARLHDAGLTHGDLTTRNVMVPDAAVPARVVLIDFGLGAFSDEPEGRGVDLHLLEEALEATEARSHALFAAFLDAYRHGACAAAAVARLEKIRERGRYR